MSDLEDVDEITLTPSRSGSAKRIRQGRKFFLMSRPPPNRARMLRRARKVPITLAGPQKAKP